MDKESDRYSERAEKCYLGGVLLDLESANDALQLGLDRLKDGQLFFREKHRYIWRAAKSLKRDDSEINSVSVAERLESNGKLGDVGGSSYLASLMKQAPPPTGADELLDIIESKYIRRKIEEADEDIDPYDTDRQPEEIVEEKIKKLEGAQQSNERVEIEHIKSGFSELFPKLEEAKEEGLMSGAMRTGFSKLTKRINGIMPNDFVVVSGQTGVGKTTFGLQVTHHIAENEDSNCLIYSGEMHGYEMALKLSSKEGISLDDLMEGNLEQEEWDHLVRLQADLADQGLYTMKQDHPTIHDFKAAVRKADREYGIDFVFLDYLQYFNNHDRFNLETHEFLEYVSQEITDFTNKKDIAVLAIARLNKSGTVHGSGKPEYDCNYHIKVTDPEPDNDEHPQKRYIELDKTRFGKEKNIPMMFDGEYSRFFEKETWKKIKRKQKEGEGNTTEQGQIWGY